MSAGNRSPLGFGPILLFHLCVLASGVLIQNLYRTYPTETLVLVALSVGLGAWAVWMFRGFLWDLFRSFKSAGILITLLVLSCVLGTFLIQDLDLRRNNTFGDPLPQAVTLERIARSVAAETGVPARQMRTGQGPSLDAARDLAIYLALDLTPLDAGEVGSYFGRDGAAAAKAAHTKVEAELDKAEDALDTLEDEIDAKYEALDAAESRASTSPEALRGLRAELESLESRKARNLVRVERRVRNDLTLPPFDTKNKPTRFAVAESHGWLWLWPNKERQRLTKKKVVLSDIEQQQVDLRRKAFGDRAANAFEAALLAGKERQVNDMTTSNFAREHFAGLYAFYKWCKELHLFDIFESLWFYMLLGLIAINVIVGTFARAPWSARDFGIAVTHAGILIILAGALLDRVVAKEGYIYFEYGRGRKAVDSKIMDMKERVYHHLPFRVALDRFATEYYHVLLVRRFDWSKRADGSPWQEGDGGGHNHNATPFNAVNDYPIRVDVPMTFEGGEVSVKFHDYKSRVFLEPDVRPDTGPKASPAVQLGIFREPTGGPNLLHGVARTWLFAKNPDSRSFHAGESRFEYVWAETPEEYDRLIRKPPVPDNGMLILRAGKEELKLKVALGATRKVQLGERTHEIEFTTIRSALADSQNVNLDRRLQRSEEPVLYLKVDGRHIFVPRDDTEFTSDFDLLRGVEFRFDWPNPADEGVYNIYRVVGAKGRPHMFVQADYDGRPSTRVLHQRRPVPMVGRLAGLHFAVTSEMASAVEKAGVREVSDEQFLAEGGGERDSLLAAWGRIEINGPWGKIEREITPAQRPIQYGDDGHGRPLYTFELYKTSMALDWFSVLTVIDHQGNRVKSHNVQVNSPLRYQGYRFFQATAETRADGFSISGISVTKNPGVNFMYLGYYVLTLGVCYIFFLRPFIDKDRRAGGVLFGFEGRLGREDFWHAHRWMLAVDIVAIISIIVLKGSGVFWFYVLFWWIPTIWPRLALLVKRSHDLNRSGTALLGLWPVVECWGVQSYPDENRWGAAPGTEAAANKTTPVNIAEASAEEEMPKRSDGEEG